MKGLVKSIEYLKTLINKFNDRGDYHIGDESSWALEDMENAEKELATLKTVNDSLDMMMTIKERENEKLRELVNEAEPFMKDALCDPSIRDMITIGEIEEWHKKKKEVMGEWCLIRYPETPFKITP